MQTAVKRQLPGTTHRRHSCSAYVHLVCRKVHINASNCHICSRCALPVNQLIKTDGNKYIFTRRVFLHFSFLSPEAIHMVPAPFNGHAVELCIAKPVQVSCNGRAYISRLIGCRGLHCGWAAKLHSAKPTHLISSHLQPEGEEEESGSAVSLCGQAVSGGLIHKDCNVAVESTIISGKNCIRYQPHQGPTPKRGSANDICHLIIFHETKYKCCLCVKNTLGITVAERKQQC